MTTPSGIALTATDGLETVGGILIANGRVLLGLRAAHKSFAGCWDIIGGHVEAGETRSTALSRELFEELGVTNVCGDLLVTVELVDATGVSSRLHVYSVERWCGEPSMQGDEHVALQWFGPAEAAALPNLVTPNYRSLFATLA